MEKDGQGKDLARKILEEKTGGESIDHRIGNALLPCIGKHFGVSEVGIECKA